MKIYTVLSDICSNPTKYEKYQIFWC